MSTKLTHTTTIYRCGRDEKVTVHFTFDPGCRGHCDKYGCPEEPDTPPSVEIDEVVDSIGPITCTERQLLEIENAIWSELERRDREHEPPTPPENLE